jgi:hypothetical protein
VPNRYRVLGLPDEKSAEITLKVTGSREAWRVRPRPARFKGFFQGPEDALAALQAAVNIETEAKATIRAALTSIGVLCSTAMQNMASNGPIPAIAVGSDSRNAMGSST